MKDKKMNCCRCDKLFKVFKNNLDIKIPFTKRENGISAITDDFICPDCYQKSIDSLIDSERMKNGKVIPLFKLASLKNHEQKDIEPMPLFTDNFLRIYDFKLDGEDMKE